MHNQVALSLKSNYALFSPCPTKTLPNPRLSPSVARRNFYYYSILKCRGIESPASKQSLNSLSFGNGSVEDDRSKSVGVKDIDVATIGNLCVDIVLNVPKLPPKPLIEREAYMDELSKSPPDKKYWEAGGNSNMAIAAARLGLHVVTVGHVGDEIYGRFLLDVLRDEGIGMVEMKEPNDVISVDYETLLCWVLVDPLQKHGFCSRADFSEEPAFSWMSTLSIEAKMAIRRSKIIFCNGYGFDELSPRLLMSALDYAVEVGTSVFFDPGPRGKSLSAGTPEERKALDKYLRMSDVLLLTSEEAESLTGTEDPILAGQELLRKGTRTKWVIIKMGPKGSILITPSSISCAPSFKVNVIDTVGCGDSFVAAIAFGFIHKMPLVNTLTIANAVGAATAMGCGAGRNVAKLKQVTDLLKGSNLNEDDKFWEELLKEHSNYKETTILTNVSINGHDNQLQRTSLQKVVCELLPKLECAETINQVGAC
ncbi:ribokinase [Phtheirospermum japonicum]|uniref:Ribokinase n=1 Tax=Phtheirospermum japonicum TaxID=374723 RepID=A0A830CET7_9LAMI|nr:ribokinase [Phtheirospermum japonicum]